jgi:sterol desaturase/sphingolipid hydroxylase (fatty acid hydroxylase superfamily)
MFAMTYTRALTAMRGLVPFVVLLVLFEVAARASSVLIGWLSRADAPVVVHELLATILVFAIVNLPLVAAERIWPGTDSPRRYLEGARFWLIALVVTFAWLKVVAWLRSQWHLEPLLDWKIDPGAPLMVAAFGLLLTIFITDGLYYWFHRAQHRFAFLWRFHSVHHSIVCLNCVNSYHHALEEVFRFPTVALPLILLVSIDAPHLVLLSAVAAGWAQYIHSDTAVHLGRLQVVFADNAYHRIHHSNRDRHFHKNFAAYFSVWDRAFGTYQAPDAEGLPPVGLTGVPPPSSLRDYLFAPFRR